MIMRVSVSVVVATAFTVELTTLLSLYNLPH